MSTKAMRSKKETKPVFTDKALAEAGWKKKKDQVFPFEKKIKNTNPINKGEDSNLKLVIHGLFNQWQFALILPDGGMVNLNITSMQDLVQFEKTINFYDPPF